MSIKKQDIKRKQASEHDQQQHLVLGMNDAILQHDDSSVLEDWEIVLHELCNPPKSKLRDPHSMRTATAAAALVETLREQLATSQQTNLGGSDELTPIGPAAIFIAALTTLTTTTSCSSDSYGSSSSSSPQQPLLEILHRVIPFVAQSNPKLYQIQFHALVRAITSVIASLPSLAMYLNQKVTSEGNHQPQNQNHKTMQEETLLGGWNSLLRLCIRTTSIALIAMIPLTFNSSSAGGEKELVTCFHSIILHHLDDSRPKVRKEAYAAVTDILQFCHTQTRQGKSTAANLDDSLKDKVLLLIPKHLTRYFHQILDTSKLFNKDSSPSSSSSHHVQHETKILHTLTLLEHTFLYLPRDMRFELWSDLIQFIVLVISDYSSKSSLLKMTVTSNKGHGPKQQQFHQTMMVHAALQTCIQSLGGLLEDSSSSSSSITRDDNDNKDKECLLAKDHITKSLASLLQLQSMIVPFAHMNRSDANHNDGSDCIVLYTRCIVSFIHSLVHISLPSIPDKLTNEKRNTVATITQLLPLCFSSLLLCLEECSRPGTITQNHGLSTHHPSTLQGICAELGRLVRVVPYLFSSDFQGFENNHIHRCIDECMTSMRKVLTLKIGDCWSMTLSALAALVVVTTQGIVPYAEMFKEKVDEGVLLTLKQLVEPLLLMIIRLYNTLRDPYSRDSIERALGDVVHGIGIELFLIMVPLTGENDLDTTHGRSDCTSKSRRIKDKIVSTAGLISQDRAWILRVLKSSTVHTSHSTEGTINLIYRPKLAFFSTTVLSWARASDKASAMPNISVAEVAVHRAQVVDAWSLFSSFCYSPVDLHISLPSFAQTLIRALGDPRYPELITIICSGLNTLVDTVTSLQTTKQLAENQDVLNRDMNALSDVSTTVLPALFKLVENLNEKVFTDSHAVKSKAKDLQMHDSDDEEDVDLKDSTKWSEKLQRVTIVTDAITSFSTVAPRSSVQTLFKKVLHRLLVAAQSQDDLAESLCAMLGLSVALVRSKVLDEDSIALLYRSIRPLIRSDEQSSRVQKRAYKAMAGICEHYTAFIITNDRLSEMTELFVGSSMTLHVPARQMRLKCMMFVVHSLDASKSKHVAVISDIMGEVLLCLKDANSKTRESAYQLLILMADIRQNFYEYIQIIVAALGAQTSHMRSAAVMALSRIVFEYASTVDSVQTLVPSLIKTVLVLFDENSREVVKAVIGFVRIGIAKISREELEPLLSDIVEGLMKFNKGKGRFRSKIKIILKKLVRYYGYEMIAPLLPATDSRLITHIRKLSERAIRNKNRTNESRDDGETLVRRFDELMSSDEDDSDNGKTLMTGATGWTKKTYAHTASEGKGVGSIAKSFKSNRSMGSATGPRINVMNGNDGEVIDLLDPRSTSNLNDTEYDENSEFSDEYGEDDEFMMFDDHGKLVIKEKARDNDDVNKTAEEDDDEASSSEHASKRQRLSKFESAKLERDEEMRRKHSQISASQRKQNIRDLGSAYKSKKAGGDVKRKDQKFEPYAYVPLDGRRYTKKNRSNTVAEMATVVRSKKRKNR